MANERDACAFLFEILPQWLHGLKTIEAGLRSRALEEAARYAHDLDEDDMSDIVHLPDGHLHGIIRHSPSSSIEAVTESSEGVMLRSAVGFSIRRPYRKQHRLDVFYDAGPQRILEHLVDGIIGARSRIRLELKSGRAAAEISRSIYDSDDERIDDEMDEAQLLSMLHKRRSRPKSTGADEAMSQIDAELYLLQDVVTTVAIDLLRDGCCPCGLAQAISLVHQIRMLAIKEEARRNAKSYLEA